MDRPNPPVPNSSVRRTLRKLFRSLAPSAEETTARENYHRVERNHGEFTRSFALPNTVDPNRVHAAFINGLPTVTLPKREEAQKKQIQVSID